MTHTLPAVDLGVFWSAIESAADQARLGVFLARLDVTPPVVLYVSPRAAALVGRTQAEIVGFPPWALLAPEDVARIRELNADPSGGPLALDVTVVRPDGGRVPLELGSARFATPDALYGFGYFRDVSAERATIVALRESEERFRFLVESAPDGVVILVNGQIVFINPSGSRLLGAPAGAVGTSILAYLPPADAQATMQRIGEMVRTGKDMPPSEYGVLVDPKRTVEIKSMLCEWEGRRAVIAFARDVTERKALHEKLVAADRFAALGKLAAGVAHEINNPLAYAQLGIELVTRRLAKLGLDPVVLGELRGHLREATHGLERIGAVAADLRTFARVDDAPPGAVDLVAIVEQSLRMTENELRHRARVDREFAEVSAVIGNASRLEQVFVNLLLNAVHALQNPATDVVTVTIDQVGEHVRVTVADTGHGIPPGVLDRVFDPFFTTKAIGDGMGLGLSVCKNLVETLHGTIAIESSEVGTRVIVALPTVARPMAVPRTMTPVGLAPTRRRVLVVDDEPFVRDTLAALLRTHHDVRAVDGGRTALDALAAETFDVILCDVMMPTMNGMELHRAIAARFPGVEQRITFVTGGAFAPELVAFLNTSGVRCLAKPFKLDQILGVIAAA